ncbi:permease [Rhodococcus sp. IEGM 1354]|uniref:permease n=1 Tax=Rhodococcus sp. IEGM 1354 TaxID=3047088 RepID=UPI0024B7C596|nr:permease [Rhodococcus sp. IEGM 1354]MDI9932578.1 permease [Rhodococcus sp. IEGM 1354]
MTADPTTPAPSTSSANWKRRGILLGAGVVLLLVAYFVLAAFLPRWWSLRVESLADRTFTKGILWGLLFGIVCTFAPLMFFWSAWSVRKGRAGKQLAIGSVILAVVTAIPNLLTLTIVLGTSNAAHAGERTLDTSAPGFRGATALGAIIAVVFVALLVFVVVRRNRRRRTAALTQ